MYMHMYSIIGHTASCSVFPATVTAALSFRQLPVTAWRQRAADKLARRCDVKPEWFPRREGRGLKCALS